MTFGLVSLHDEIRLFNKITEFYKKLYPKMRFTTEEKMCKPNEIGGLLYTYAGEEIESLSAEKIAQIEQALPDYTIPAIILKKGKMLIVLDGHRRLRVAWKKQIPWKVLILVAPKNTKFGIEETIAGKIKEIYGI